MKKPLFIIVFFTLTLNLSGCMYVTPVHFNNIHVDGVGRTQYPGMTTSDKGKIRELTKAIMGLSPNVNKEEAMFVAYEAVLYPKVLANKYNLMSPPNYQNHLVNTGSRKRGLCFEWAEDLMAHLQRPYKTLTLERGMAFQWKSLEHNVPTIRAKGQAFSTGIILDAWRESSSLVWMKVKNDDAYPWVAFIEPRLTRPRYSKLTPRY